MRLPIAVGLLLGTVLLLTGCPGIERCVSDDDCADGRTCVNRRCFGFPTDTGTDVPPDLSDASDADGAPDADACVPDCGEKECGDDGCGGSCGECWPGEECHPDGTCGEPLCGNGVLDPGERCEIYLEDPPTDDDSWLCPFGCEDGDACTIDEMIGKPEECNSRCERIEVISDCVHRDGCCPPGCTAPVDNDCPSVCGDGHITAGERCDGDCPTREECDDGAACTVDYRGNPDTCTAECTRFTRDECFDGDGCCPAGCRVIEDSDCPASTCERYCSMAEDYCRGENALFDDANNSGSAEDECLQECANFPFPTGRLGQRTGDSLWCRIHQLDKAILEPDDYCPQASELSTECI